MLSSSNSKIHHESIPCGSSSIFGVEKSKDKEEVTCKVCIRCLKVKMRREEMPLFKDMVRRGYYRETKKPV